MKAVDEFADVKIVELESMRVVYYKIIGEQPEELALGTIGGWAKEKGLMSRVDTRVYGFNNPEPKKDEKMYGYEFCITIPESFTENDCYPFSSKILPGGIFGSIKFKFKDMGKTWEKMIRWIKQLPLPGTHYRCDQGPLLWREETMCLKNEYNDVSETDMILYIPVIKA